MTVFSRRDFVRAGGAAAACALAGLARAADGKTHMSKAPSILLVIADDWSWPHAGAYGDPVARTPAFDRLAREGMLFTHAFCAAPTCTASRGSILTGQAPHRLREGANLWSTLPADIPVYPDLLEQAGYFVGHCGKGWGPGKVEAGGRTRNPAGPAFGSFAEFLDARPSDAPFCFWLGSRRPHRPYTAGRGVREGLDAERVAVPPFLPDSPEVRSDLADYYAEVAAFDSEVGEALRLLEERGLDKNTLVVVTSDNGMPFPRAKANLYEAGIRMPLAVRWPGRVKPGTRVRDLVSLTDLAPTFLEAASVAVPEEMTGQSFLDILLEGRSRRLREAVFAERERHAAVRAGSTGYPCRAIRTSHFLYIRNLHPERWPAGDPGEADAELDVQDLAKGPFGDIDNGPTKRFLLANREAPGVREHFQRATALRPAEELFDLSVDPWTLRNVAPESRYSGVLARMRECLDRWMETTGDPRSRGEDGVWDTCPYYGPVR